MARNYNRSPLAKVVSFLGFWSSLYGIFIILLQSHFFISEGMWIKLPLSYVVYVPESAVDLGHYFLEQNLEGKAIPSDSSTIVAITKRIDLTKSALAFVPNNLLGDTKWFSAPKSWIGVHDIVMSVLDFLGMGISFIAPGIILFLKA